MDGGQPLSPPDNAGSFGPWDTWLALVRRLKPSWIMSPRGVTLPDGLVIWPGARQHFACGSTGDRKDSPLIGYTFQRMGAPVLESDARASHKILDRARYQHFTSLGES